MDAVEFVARAGTPLPAAVRVRPGRPACGATASYVEQHAAFSLDAALAASTCVSTALPVADRQACYAQYLRAAAEWAERLGEPRPDLATAAATQFGELQFFNVD